MLRELGMSLTEPSDCTTLERSLRLCYRRCGRSVIPADLRPQGAFKMGAAAVTSPHRKLTASMGVSEASTTAARLPCCHATMPYGLGREMKAERHRPRQVRENRSFAPSKSPFAELRSKPQAPQTA